MNRASVDVGKAEIRARGNLSKRATSNQDQIEVGLHCTTHYESFRKDFHINHILISLEPVPVAFPALAQ